MKSRRANPVVIGAFVTGAILLAILCLVLFGSQRFFSPQEKFVLYFKETVHGLEDGAAVKFKGVPIGSVKRIQIQMNNNSNEVYVPVIISIEKGYLLDSKGNNMDLGKDEVFYNHIKEGLRAKMQYQSYVTGMLYIELDYIENAPLPVFINQESKYKEIPTMESNFDEVISNAYEALAKLEKIDFVTIGNRLESIVVKLDDGLSEIEFKEINDSAIKALNAVHGALDGVDFSKTLALFDNTLEGLDDLSLTMKDSIKFFNKKIKHIVTRFDTTFDNIDDFLGPNSVTRYKMDKAFDSMNKALESIGELADYVERNPRVLLTGQILPRSQKTKSKR